MWWSIFSFFHGNIFYKSDLPLNLKFLFSDSTLIKSTKSYLLHSSPLKYIPNMLHKHLLECISELINRFGILIRTSWTAFSVSPLDICKALCLIIHVEAMVLGKREKLALSFVPFPSQDSHCRFCKQCRINSYK